MYKCSRLTLRGVCVRLHCVKEVAGSARFWLAAPLPQRLDLAALSLHNLKLQGTAAGSSTYERSHAQSPTLLKFLHACMSTQYAGELC